MIPAAGGGGEQADPARRAVRLPACRRASPTPPTSRSSTPTSCARTRATAACSSTSTRGSGAITAGGDVIASSDPTDGRLRFLRTYPADTAMAFAPVTGYFSFQYRSSGLELAEDAILNGNDDRLFGQRFMDMFAGRDPRGGNVLTTIRPRSRRRRTKPCATGAATVGAAVRSSRSSPAPARSSPWPAPRRTTPTNLPVTTSRSGRTRGRRGRTRRTRPTRCSTARSTSSTRRARPSR